MSKYDPEYYNANKGTIQKSHKMWYEKNKEAIHENMRKRRMNRNAEQIENDKAKRREYYSKNKQKFSDYNKERREQAKAELAALREKVKKLEEKNDREN